MEEWKKVGDARARGFGGLALVDVWMTETMEERDRRVTKQGSSWGRGRGGRRGHLGSCGIGPHYAAPAGTLSVEETHVPTEVLGSCVEPDPVVEEERSALLLGLLGGGLLLGRLLLGGGLLGRGLGDRGSVSDRGLDLFSGGGLLHRGGLLGGRLLGRLLGGHASETHGWLFEDPEARLSIYLKFAGDFSQKKRFCVSEVSKNLNKSEDGPRGQQT